jgi:lipopolysaccharide transport system permease protein
MAEGLSKSISAIISKVPLVKQAIFPINILPVVSVSASFISLMVGITIYLILMLIFAPNQLSLYLLLLPLVVFFQFIFMLGLGYLLAIGGVYFRDLQELIGLLLTIGMFVTPILWTDEMVPHVFAWPMRFNLLAHLIYMYRDILFYGRIIHPLSFAIFLPTSIAIFIVGYLSFNKVKHLFANIL